MTSVVQPSEQCGSLASVDLVGTRSWELHDALGSVKLTLDDVDAPDYAAGYGYSPFGTVASGAVPLWEDQHCPRAGPAVGGAGRQVLVCDPDAAPGLWSCSTSSAPRSPIGSIPSGKQERKSSKQ